MDKTWWIVGITACISIIFNGAIIGWKKTLEGIAIILTVLILISVTSLADWFKDKKLLELGKLIKEESIPVIRGKLGATQTISVWNVVVGDVILLTTGSQAPADCIIIDSNDLKIDEPQYLAAGEDHDPYNTQDEASRFDV